MARAKVVTVTRWYAHDEVNQEKSEQNEVDGMKKGADFTGKVMHMWKSGCGLQWGRYTDDPARVTTDEKRVLPVDWTDIRLCR